MTLQHSKAHVTAVLFDTMMVLVIRSQGRAVPIHQMEGGGCHVMIRYALLCKEKSERDQIPASFPFPGTIS